MLELLICILLVLWLCGVIALPDLGGNENLIHILLVIALVLLIARFARRRD